MALASDAVSGRAFMKQKTSLYLSIEGLYISLKQLSRGTAIHFPSDINWFNQKMQLKSVMVVCSAVFSNVTGN